MKAGRELDALVAEKIMGWTVMTGAMDGGDWGALPDWGKPPDWDRPISEPTVRRHPYYQIPHYSTDVAAAGLVIERLLDRYTVTFHRFPDGSYSCQLVTVRRVHVATEMGRTTTHALCCASLKTVEKEG